MEATQAYKSKSFTITITALMTALTCSGGFIRISTPFLDITMQTFFACMAGLLLGKKWGTVSQAVYAFIGLIGVPVFTRGGGIAYLFQPSFGFILGFILCAFICGFLRDIVFKSQKKSNNSNNLWKDVLKTTVICLAGLVGLYIIGGPYMLFILKVYFHYDSAAMLTALLSLPWFVLGDVISLIILIFIIPILFRRVPNLLKI